MSVYRRQKKWRSVKIHGQVIKKIYHNGKIIFDYSKPLSNPILGAQIINVSGSNNVNWTVDRSGWYRFGVGAAAGGNTSSFGHGRGGRISSVDLFLEQGWRILAWGASGRITGAPASIKGGNGQEGATLSGWANPNSPLGGGGRNGANGYHSGGGGAGAAGDGLAAPYSEENGQYGGGGAGIIIYKGDDYTNQANWLYLILAGGGGGGGGHSTKPRNGGAGGGAGSNGGANRNGAGGTGGYNNVAGIIKGGDTEKSGNYGGYGEGAANVLDVRDAANPKLVKARDGFWDSSAGYASGWRLS